MTMIKLVGRTGLGPIPFHTTQDSLGGEALTLTNLATSSPNQQALTYLLLIIPLEVNMKVS